MQAFGSGMLFGTPLTDVNGNAISNPTPVKLATLQDFSLDLSFDAKELHGERQIALDIGRGKGKIMAKAKSARIYSRALSVMFTGQPLTTGITAIYSDMTGAAIPATPFTITVAPPNSGVFAADLGVLNAAGLPMQRVASAPTTGQYSVTVGTGAYLFAAADTGLTVYINYRYTVAAATSGSTQALTNPLTGPIPTFRADMQLIKASKIFYVGLNNSYSTKLMLASKQDDFTIPEFDIGCLDDGTGNVGTISCTD